MRLSSTGPLIRAPGLRSLTWIVFVGLVWTVGVCGSERYGVNGAFLHTGHAELFAGAHSHDTGHHDSRVRDNCCFVLQQLSASVVSAAWILALHGAYHALSIDFLLSTAVAVLFLAAGAYSAAGPPFYIDLPGKLEQLIDSVQPNAPPR